MNRTEAIQAMLAGKKVTNRDFEHGSNVGYCFYNSDAFGTFPFLYHRDGNDDEPMRCVWGSETDEWEEYQEPKKKVKMWKWLCMQNDRKPYNTMQYYKNKESVERDLGKVVIARLDYTEIEVEE